MNLRLAILTLAAKYELSADAGAELKQLAHLGAEPPSLSKQLPLGMAVLGAVVGGLGIIFWIAANWESLSRSGRFALLQATMACMLIGAWRRPGARVPLSLVGFLACGALFAYFGQTYQTGADPWQLFALWAALTLPLCLGVRHEALWTAWAVVALTAALLWAQTPEGPRWQRSPFRISLGWWVPAIALALAFRLAPVRLTGAGLWPMRLCMIYATLGLAATAVWSLFSSDSKGIYPTTLLTLAILAYAFSRRSLFDVFVVSALGLGANVLLLSGLTRLLLRGSHDTLTGAVLVIGCVAAALLAGTVKLIMHLTREYAGEQTRERVA